MMKLYRKVWLVGLSLVWATLVIQAMLATPPVRAAGPWYVGPGGSDGSACTSVATRCASINGALAKPGFEAGDTIRVQTGTYTGSGDEVVLLDKSATLSGGWNAAFSTQDGMSTIDGEDLRRGVQVNPGIYANIERFTALNGTPNTYYNFGNLTLTNSSISNNNDNYGVYNYSGGTVTLNNSTVSGSNTYGGIGNNSGGTITLNNSAINRINNDGSITLASFCCETPPL